LRPTRQAGYVVGEDQDGELSNAGFRHAKPLFRHYNELFF
jgi:hypothetical protein